MYTFPMVRWPIQKCLVAILWLLAALPVIASESKFDYDAALATSQAAIGNPLGDYRFTSADGKTLTLAQMRGKPLVLSMVYTSCYQICPMTTRYLAGVIEKARETLGEDSFNVAVIGFDTRMDTPDAMAHFGRQQGISDANWYLLSGSQADVDSLARDTGFLYIPAAHGYDHLIQATVIDAKGEVYRQVYGQVFDTPLLVDPLIELVYGRDAPDRPVLENLIAKIKLFCTTYNPATDGYYFDYSLFLGILIGLGIIAVTGNFVVRSWFRH